MSYSIAGLISPGIQNSPNLPSTGPVDERGTLFQSADYHPILSNWYTAQPYGFRFTPRDSTKSSMMMFLPIGPSNLSVVTNFATNFVSTLYGTVEEHSPVRYYDISIEGTTGMGPKYIAPFATNSAAPNAEIGRSSFSVVQGINTQGFFSKTVNAGLSSVSATKALLGVDPPSVATGLYLDKTGYAAFHNLYRFLLQYKKDAAGVGADALTKRPTNAQGNDIHPISFFNYKDNNEYKVVIRSFTLRRDKEDPMLYFYSITMRGYDLQSAGIQSNVNGGLNTKTLLDDLGLNGVKGASVLTQMKDFSSQAKSVLGTLGSGINVFGR